MADAKLHRRSRIVALRVADLEEFVRRLRDRFPQICVAQRQEGDEDVYAFLDGAPAFHGALLLLESPPEGLGSGRDAERSGAVDGTRLRSSGIPFVELDITATTFDRVPIWRQMPDWYPELMLRPFVDLSLMREHRARDPDKNRLRGAWRDGDVGAKRFVEAVFRVADGFLTNSYDWYSAYTLEFLYTETGARYWTGPATIALALENKGFFAFRDNDSTRRTDRFAKPVPRSAAPGRKPMKLA